MKSAKPQAATPVAMLVGLTIAIGALQANAQSNSPTCQQPGGQQLPGCASSQNNYNGEVFRGAARGAARGALIGSISGNAGRGAAIGATTGGVFAAGRRAAFR